MEWLIGKKDPAYEKDEWKAMTETNVKWEWYKQTAYSTPHIQISKNRVVALVICEEAACDQKKRHAS
jgi:hypothetical protein